jgi:hypothetical protein
VFFDKRIDGKFQVHPRNFSYFRFVKSIFVFLNILFHCIKEKIMHSLSEKRPKTFSTFIALAGLNRDRVVCSSRKTISDFIGWIGNHQRWFGEPVFFIECDHESLSEDEKKQLQIPKTLDPPRNTLTVKGENGPQYAPLRSWRDMALMTSGGSSLVVSPQLKSIPTQYSYQRTTLYEVIYPTNFYIYSHLHPLSFGQYWTDLQNNRKAVSTILFQEIAFDSPRKKEERFRRLYTQMGLTPEKKTKLVGASTTIPAFYYAVDGVWVAQHGQAESLLYRFEPYEERLLEDNRHFWQQHLKDME